MRGLMMETPLTLRQIAERAERLFPDRELVSRTASGTERSSYGELCERARRLAVALRGLGIEPGDRVASFGWNSRRHLELYLAVPCMGAVLHTLNIRLFEDQVAYIANHAEDRVVFCDASLAPVLAKVRERLTTVERVVLMPDAPDGGELGETLDYEELLAGAEPLAEWPELDEGSAAIMCYTSGTTGEPKGVAYSHRSMLLHTLGVNQAEAAGMTERDVVVSVVPMFHANAWGYPYAAAMAGSKQCFPGPRMAPADIASLIASEQATLVAGVPTVWLGMAELDPPPDLSSLREIMAGGSAVPEALIRTYQDRFGVTMVQGYGMTETSPLAFVSRLSPEAEELPEDERFALRARQGRPIAGVEIRVVGEDGEEVPWDDRSAGELHMRGPWIARAYYRQEGGGERFSDDGWLRSGDVAVVAPGGWVKLVDRTKDLVKSGGEWISSVELESEIMAHPDVIEAAVIAIPHEKWIERPAAYVVKREGAALSEEGVAEFLGDRVAKWWLPDEVHFIDEIPKTSVGKFDKKVLRARRAAE